MSAAPHDHDPHDHDPHDRDPFDGDPFEHGRDFPSEAEWLDLPMPELPEQPPATDDGARDDDFASRVLRARDEERELDAELARLDAELPPSVLQQFVPPPVTDGFVDATVAAIQRDRQQRWRALMARYVAPEPSPQFVDRTLHALFGSPGAGMPGVTEGTDAGFEATAAAARRGAAAPLGPPPAADPAAPGPRRLAWHAPHERRSIARRAVTRWGWAIAAVAAAAAVLLWLPTPTEKPFELRVAEATPADRTWTDAVSPLPTMLAAVAASEEPDGLFDTPVSALWLATAAEARR